MAKALYAAKMVLLKIQFQLKQSQEKKLRELVLFVCTAYARARFESFCADVAVNDLALLRNLIAYCTINAAISEAVVKTFQMHLRYVGTDLAVLPLFSEKLPQTRRRMSRRVSRRRGLGGRDGRLSQISTAPSFTKPCLTDPVRRWRC